MGESFDFYVKLALETRWIKPVDLPTVLDNRCRSAASLAKQPVKEVKKKEHQNWWAHLDSNQGPTGYEPVALTN